MPCVLPTRTIYSGTNRITNFNCKIDFVQLLRRLRLYAPSTPPARSELQLVRGFTKLSLRRRRRRTVSTGERRILRVFLPSAVDIKSYDARASARMAVRKFEPSGITNGIAVNCSTFLFLFFFD